MLRLIALWLATSVAFAQAPPVPAGYQSPPAFSQQELDQMLAPIALYPDPLLSQILMAATYPLEVVEAARWSRANPGLRGEDAVRAAASYPWDPSVKSMLAFAQILAMMDQRLDWTQRLGNAFLAQQAQVMDTIQALRRRAYQAGNLRSGVQMRFEDRDGIIALEPASPQLFYVPYYDPLIVYGPWWWPGYPPVYWPAWPGYAAGPSFAAGLLWGVGIAIAADFFFGDWDWRHHYVSVRPGNFYYRGAPGPGPGTWRHDPEHRRGVPYRGETVRQQFAHTAAAPAPDARRPYRGFEAPAAGSAPVQRARPQAPAGVAPQPAVRPQGAGAVQPRVPMRPQPQVAPRAEPAPKAFEGIRAGGAQTRQYSARGQSSMSSRPAPSAGPRGGGGAPAPRGGRRP